MPLILARIYEEDIKFTDGKQILKFKISPTSFQKEQMSECEKMIENLDENLDYRNGAKRESIVKLAGRSSDPHDIDLEFDNMLEASKEGRGS